MDNVLDDVVQELAVVGDDNGCAGGAGEVVLEPLDVLDVQMVGGLVKEENIGLLEDSTGKRKLHLPATREGSDGSGDLLLGEVELPEGSLNGVLSVLDTDIAELLDCPVDDSHLSIGRVQVVLDVHGLDLVLLGETLDLLVVDGTHEGGLTGTVGSEKTVTLTTLETEVSLVEQDLSTVGQVECAVAEILALLLIGLDSVLSSGGGERLLAEVVGDVLGLLVADKDSDEGASVSQPVERLEVLLVDELTTDSTNVLDNRSELVVKLVLGGKDSLQVASNGGNVAVPLELGDLAILDGTDTDEGVETLAGLLTGLGVSKVVVVLLKSRHELGQESGDNLGVLDKLAHVVNDDSSLTLDGSLALDETTLKEGNHDSQGGLVDVSDESGGTEQVNGLGDVLGLSDTLDELGNEALDILVGDQGAELLHGGVSGLLDLSLGVPHGTGDDGDQVGDTESHLGGSRVGEELNALEVGHLLGPLLGGLERV